ncbi:hypothetical protein Dimus_006369, partial [Dionaea muscipula]
MHGCPHLTVGALLAREVLLVHGRMAWPRLTACPCWPRAVGGHVPQLVVCPMLAVSSSWLRAPGWPHVVGDTDRHLLAAGDAERSARRLLAAWPSASAWLLRSRGGHTWLLAHDGGRIKLASLMELAASGE